MRGLLVTNTVEDSAVNFIFMYNNLPANDFNGVPGTRVYWKESYEYSWNLLVSRYCGLYGDRNEYFIMPSKEDSNPGGGVSLADLKILSALGEFLKGGKSPEKIDENSVTISLTPGFSGENVSIEVDGYSYELSEAYMLDGFADSTLEYHLIYGICTSKTPVSASASLDSKISKAFQVKS